MKPARTTLLLGTALLAASAASATEWDRHGGGRHETNYTSRPAPEHGRSAPTPSSHSDEPQAPKVSVGRPARWNNDSTQSFHANETHSNAPNRFESGNPDLGQTGDARTFPRDNADGRDYLHARHDHDSGAPSENNWRVDHPTSNAGRPPGGNFVYPHEPVHHFSGRDVANFDRHDRDMWRGGRWNHGWHHHRYGWWWFTGGLWYFYDAPLYPYPEYVSSDAYEDDQPYDDNGNYWYYCRNPEGYYPYVRQCNLDWEMVPAQPYDNEDSYDQGPPQDDEYDDPENDDDNGY